MNLKSLFALFIVISSLGFEARAQNYLYVDSGFTESDGWSTGCCRNQFSIIIQDDELLGDRSDSLKSLNFLFLFGFYDLPPESWTEDTVIVNFD